MTDATDALWMLWGKASPARDNDGNINGPEWHPLLCHMVDVMCVGEVLLDRLPPALLRTLMEPLGGRSGKAWLLLLLGLHDAGKALPGFQYKWPGNIEIQAAYGLEPAQKECHPHGVSGTALLECWLADPKLLGAGAVEADAGRALARAVASHHGAFPDDGAVETCWCGDIPRLSESWRSAHRTLVRTFIRLTGDGVEMPPLSPNLHRNSPLLLALAGLTSVADWIGSNTDFFPYTRLPVDLDSYVKGARERAQRAVDELGWYQPLTTPTPPFESMFPFPPRALQRTAVELGSSLDKPCLVIAESTMGDGKTEFALYLADVLRSSAGAQGLFVALPTQATANQMLRRVRDFLERTYPETANLHLVHGDAALSEDYRELKLRAIYGDSEGNEGQSRVLAASWFTKSKRSLLASHAVGTIDQGLLGVLRTKHGFVRLFGLAGKVVVLDEVHAYDTYTSELLYRLVAWLGALGSSVIVLSATLPSARRKQLVEAYKSRPAATEAPYPRVTVAVREQAALSIGTTASRPSQQLDIQFVDDDNNRIVELIGTSLSRCGCVAWICNTVERAQRAFLELEEAIVDGRLPNDTDLGLLHSRLLRRDRARREKTAAGKFGPGAERPHRAILVGTQVLEQSLDYDFDLMISDLAPIDLVLQRAGRLHRHHRELEARATKVPTLILVQPDCVAGVPAFDEVARVYDKSIMFKTWWALRTTTTITVPDELEGWVERIYGDCDDRPPEGPLLDFLSRAERETEDKRTGAWSMAQHQLLFDPNTRSSNDRLGDVYPDLEDSDDAELHESLRAMTRLAEASSEVVCVWSRGEAYYLDATSNDSVSLEQVPLPNVQREMLLNSVKVADWRLKRIESELVRPPCWAKVPALRHKVALLLDVEGCNSEMFLHPRLGLVFGRLAKELQQS